MHASLESHSLLRCFKIVRKRTFHHLYTLRRFASIKYRAITFSYLEIRYILIINRDILNLFAISIPIFIYILNTNICLIRNKRIGNRFLILWNEKASREKSCCNVINLCKSNRNFMRLFSLIIRLSRITF